MLLWIFLILVHIRFLRFLMYWLPLFCYFRELQCYKHYASVRFIHGWMDHLLCSEIGNPLHTGNCNESHHDIICLYISTTITFSSRFSWEYVFGSVEQVLQLDLYFVAHKECDSLSIKLLQLSLEASHPTNTSKHKL